jgi:hypothetical protein
MATALTGLALAGRGGADPGWSARLHGAADQALADLGHTLEPLEGRLANLDRQRLRAAMGAEAFEAEYAAGRVLDPARVLAALGRTDTQRGQRVRRDCHWQAKPLTGRQDVDQPHPRKTPPIRPHRGDRDALRHQLPGGPGLPGRQCREWPAA